MAGSYNNPFIIILEQLRNKINSKRPLVFTALIYGVKL